MASVRGAHHDAAVPAAGAMVSGERAAEWMKQAQAGDRAAFGKVVEAFQDRVYNAVLKIVGDRDDARELTQEAFLRALANLAGFRGDSSPYTWLFRIATNLAIGAVRKGKRRRTYSIDQDRDEAHNGQAANLIERVSNRADEAIEEKERAKKVTEALQRVDAEYRAILVMRDVEGMEYGQISEVLELPLGTVKSRLFRARLALRQELAEYMGSQK